MVAMNLTFASKYDAKCRNYDWGVADAHMRDLASEAVDWHLCPDGFSYLFLDYYLTWRVFCKGQNSDLSQTVLDLAHRRATEAEARNQFESSDSSIGFPACRRRHLSSAIWIDAFHRDATLGESAVRRLAVDERAIAAEVGPRRWDGLPQSDFLDAIFLLLLVDDYDAAADMTRAARTMKALHVKELFGVCKMILDRRSAVHGDEDVRKAFRSSFDALRDPDYDDCGKNHLGALTQLLTLACVWQKYFQPGQGTYSLEAAVDLIRE